MKPGTPVRLTLPVSSHSYAGVLHGEVGVVEDHTRVMVNGSEWHRVLWLKAGITIALPCKYLKEITE